MAVLTKPATNNKKHYTASYIKTVSVPPGYDHGVLSASIATGSSSGSYADKSFSLSDKAFHRTKFGGGSRHPELRQGLRSKPRFNMVLITDGERSGMEQITNVHTYPLDYYAECDMEQVLKMPISMESAVVQIYPKTGDIDIFTFPATFYKANLLKPFLAKLEATTKFDYDDSFMIGNVRFSISDIRGSIITYSCVKQRGM